jgi:RNA-directed DNA polymerase
MSLATPEKILSASPSKRSVLRLKTKVRDLLVPGNHAPWPEVRDDLNRSLRGWSSYFRLGTPVAAFLARRHKVAGRGKPVGEPDTGNR